MTKKVSVASQAERRNDLQGFLYDIFEGDISDVYEGEKSLHFRISGGKLNYRTLKRLSVELGTEKINLAGGETGGGCESCDYGNEKYVEVEVEGITKEYANA